MLDRVTRKGYFEATATACAVYNYLLLLFSFRTDSTFTERDGVPVCSTATTRWINRFDCSRSTKLRSLYVYSLCRRNVYDCV